MSKSKKNIFRYLPMDLGRVVIAPSPLWYRHKRLKVDGTPYKERLKGGVLIVANHVDFSDPIALGTCFWYRRVHFLAAKEVMRNPLVALLLKGMGCIRIDREISDIDAIRRSVGVLKDGKCLAMFPQGGIRQPGEIDKIKSGAVRIAMQAGVPILPVYSRRRKYWWQRRKVVIGELFDCRAHCEKRFPSVADITHLSELLLEKLEECEKTYEQAN